MKDIIEILEEEEKAENIKDNEKFMKRLAILEKITQLKVQVAKLEKALEKYPIIKLEYSDQEKFLDSLYGYRK